MTIDVTEIEAKNDYVSLIEKANTAAQAYYDTDELVMSDEEYDTIVDRIQAYEDEYGWNDADAVLNRVAAGQSAGGDVKHTVPMLSLAKANTFEEVTSFVKNLNTVAGGNVKVLPEPKLDGLAISVLYRNGRIVQIATRGDGQTGEDITARVSKSVSGLPTSLEHTSPIEIRGEVYITATDFKTANLNRMAFEFAEWKKRNPTADAITPEVLVAMAEKNRLEGTKHVVSGKTNFAPEKFLFANSRNAVAGALRREKTPYIVPMSFAAYDVYAEGSEDKDYSDKIAYIEGLGVRAAATLIPADIRNAPILEAVEKFGEIRLGGLEYPTDGIVLKANSIAVRNRVGSGSKSPKWAIAYKYPSISQKTVVQGIEVTIGRTGRLSLRAKVSPVLVDGTLINYASLHNVSWLEEKDIRIGDTVNIRRANDVIPYIDSAILALRPADTVSWVAPAVCPQCGEAWDKTTLLWRCPSLSCGALNGVIHAAGRDYFDWEGLSEAIITRLNDNGLVTDISDVFALTEKQLAELVMRTTDEGKPVYLGEKVAKKVYAEIQKSKTRPLSAVLAALGVRTLGRTFGRRLEAHYGDMSKIVNASAEQLTDVEGIAKTKADIIYAGLQEKLAVIARLAQAGVTMTSTLKKPASGTNPFVGKKVCITGSVPGYTRGQAQELLTELGATASSSVSSSTNYLVADEDSEGSSKYKKAVQLGTTILAPDEFLKMAGKK
jgi:DNA ligase (NAD+)